MSFKVGFGYDVHKFKKGRDLILGGVKIDYEYGLEGYSDADCLVHAVCDAILGAAGLGDIGEIFPDNDERYKDANSLLFLKHIGDVIKKNGYAISNVDVTVAMQSPKIAAYKHAMIEKMSSVLNIDNKKINIKATTTEGLGFEGRLEGVSAYAVVLLENLHE